MAIAPSSLASAADNTDHASLDPFVIPSVNPTGPVLMALTFAADESPAIEPNLPQLIQGNGLSWTLIEDVFYKHAGLNMRAKMALYTGTGSPVAETISIYFNFVCVGMAWQVIDIPGADAASPLVGGQVASLEQSTPAGTTITATLPTATPNAAGDRCFTFAAGNNAVSSFTPRASWTELSEKGSGTPSQCIETQWRSDAFEQTGSATNGTGSGFPCGIIVVEAAVASAGGGGGPGGHKELALLGVG